MQKSLRICASFLFFAGAGPDSWGAPRGDASCLWEGGQEEESAQAS